MFAQVYLVESKLRKTVSLGKVYEVPRDGNLVRIPYNPNTFDSEKRYFVEEGEFLQRIFILQTAESEAQLLQSIDKAEKASRRTVRIPKRRSLGELKISLIKFQDNQQSNKDKSAVKAVVNAVRTDDVLQKMKECKTLTKIGQIATQDPPPTNEALRLDTPEGSESNKVVKDNKISKGGAYDAKSLEVPKKLKKTQAGKNSEASKKKLKSTEDGKYSHKNRSSKSSEQGDAQNVSGSTNQKDISPDKKTSDFEATTSKTKAEQGAGTSSLDRQKLGSEKSDHEGNTTVQQRASTSKDLDCQEAVRKSSQVNFHNFESSLSRTSTPVKSSSKMDDNCKKCELLNQKVISLESEIRSLKSQLSQQSEQFKIIQTMNNNLQNLCSAVTQQASDSSEKGEKKKTGTSSACKIKLTSNLTEEEGIDIPPTKIYIGKGQFIDKSGLIAVETKKPRNFKTRMEGVVKLVWPDGDAKHFNLTGSDGKKVVEEYQVNAVHNLLNLLSWKNIMIKPLKVNKKMVEPLTFEHVKRKLGIYLSEMNPKKDEDNEKKKEVKEKEKEVKGKKKEVHGKKKGKKVVNSESSDGYESESGDEDKAKEKISSAGEKENKQAANDTIILESGSEDDDEEVVPPTKRKKIGILDDSFDYTSVKVKEEPTDNYEPDESLELDI